MRARVTRFLVAAGVIALCSTALTAGSAVGFHLERTQPFTRFDAGQIALLERLNRADAVHLRRLRMVVVPDRWDLDLLAYSPMPQEVPGFAGNPKAIVVDLTSQVFGAYEHGHLVRWGPVSSGDEEHATPAGSYHLNWKDRLHTSSFNPDWVMPYTYNFDTVLGLAFHQFAMVGRPASHGCVRMLGPDAQWIYEWGQQGTPVLLVGDYDFSASQPWLDPQWWAQGVQLLDIETASVR
jgi:lipoprotein-anchoring transpeptidase ErfK/SrfK